MQSPRDIFTFYDPSTKVWSGTRTTSLYNPHQSLGAFVLSVLAKNPGKVIQISADTGALVTASEMRLRTIRVAQNLTRMGFTQEHTLTLAVRNGELVAPVLFACFALGIKVNTLDPAFQRDDFSSMMTTVQSQVVVCDVEAWPEMKAGIKTAGAVPLVFVFGGDVECCRNVEELFEPTGQEDLFVPPHFEDAASRVAMILYSSGTTGRPKGVSLSHSVCIANIANFTENYTTDVILTFSTLYWISGLGMFLMGTTLGATRVITRDSFSPELALELIEKHRVSITFMSPAAALQLINHPRAQTTDFSSLRIIYCGGGPVSAELKNSLETMAPQTKCHVAYGMSELGGLVALSDSKIYKSGSVGFLRPTVEAKIVDDLGNPLDIGQEGEILVKTDFMFSGYHGNEAATANAFDSDGWLRTGDVGRFDEDGVLFVVDRKKDIMKYEGYQISPTEIETVIQTVPGVYDVCVAGIPVPGSDLPAALVMTEDGTKVSEEDINQAVRDNLGNYKQLRGGVYFASQLPMTASGKKVRRQCQSIMVELFNNADGNKKQE